MWQGRQHLWLGLGDYSSFAARAAITWASTSLVAQLSSEAVYLHISFILQSLRVCLAFSHL